MPNALRRLPVIFQYRHSWQNTTFIKDYACLASSASAERSNKRTPIRLRDYQEDCIQAILSYFEKGGKRAGVSLATGSGKSIIFTQLIERVEAPSPDATQTLILAHRRELVEQAVIHCENAYPTKTIEVEMGNTKATGTADVTVGSVSSLISGDRIQKFDPTRFKLVLVDEAHHIAAASYMQILRYFGLVADTSSVGAAKSDDVSASSHETPSPALVGVSATFSRFDGVRLSDAIDHIVYHKDYVDMIGEKWLSDVIFTTVQSKADLSRVKQSKFQDFQTGDLSRAVNNPTSNAITVKAWMSKTAIERRSTLVFCVDLAHVTDLTATFRSHGIDARFVTSETPKKIRSERLEAFKHEEFPVLLNCGVFTEGTDIPNIDCVMLARPTKSRNLLVQMIGRGMRLHPGKKNCHVIDMVASLEAGIVTTPTLFGLDPAALVQEANVKDLTKLREREQLEEERREEGIARAVSDGPQPSSPPRSITFTDYDSVYDLIGDTSNERHIRSISRLTWVRVKDDRYILSSQSGDYIAIEGVGSGEGYCVNYVKRIREVDRSPESTAKSPYMRPREIAQTEMLSDAVHAADTFASQTFPWHYVHYGQSWRKAPATEGQLALINKLRPMQDQLTPDRVTKGQATDMISKIKFGAKGWFNEMEADKRRKIKGGDSMRQREQVKVGPLGNPPAPEPKSKPSRPAPGLTLREALVEASSSAA